MRYAHNFQLIGKTSTQRRFSAIRTRRALRLGAINPQV
jgi:hypothetical protein